jgi:hypothetical protein
MGPPAVNADNNAHVIGSPHKLFDAKILRYFRSLPYVDFNTTDWHVHCALITASPIAGLGILLIIRQKPRGLN